MLDHRGLQKGHAKEFEFYSAGGKFSFRNFQWGGGRGAVGRDWIYELTHCSLETALEQVIPASSLLESCHLLCGQIGRPQPHLRLQMNGTDIIKPCWAKFQIRPSQGPGKL